MILLDILRNNKKQIALKMVEKKFLNIKETSEMIGLSVTTINRLIRANEIPSYFKGGRRLFDKEELIEWVKGKKENSN